MLSEKSARNSDEERRDYRRMFEESSGHAITAIQWETRRMSNIRTSLDDPADRWLTPEIRQ
jgi:hypothetical protein